MRYVYSDCGCPKCVDKRIREIIEDGEIRRIREQREMAERFEKAMQDHEKKHWPCGEPRQTKLEGQKP